MKDIRYGAVDPEIMLTLNAPKIIVERANDDDSVCCKWEPHIVRTGSVLRYYSRWLYFSQHLVSSCCEARGLIRSLSDLCGVRDIRRSLWLSSFVPSCGLWPPLNLITQLWSRSRASWLRRGRYWRIKDPYRTKVCLIWRRGEESGRECWEYRLKSRVRKQKSGKKRMSMKRKMGIGKLGVKDENRKIDKKKLRR